MIINDADAADVNTGTQLEYSVGGVGIVLGRPQPWRTLDFRLAVVTFRLVLPYSGSDQTGEREQSCF